MNLLFFTSLIKKKEFKNSVWNIADIMLLPLLMLLFTPFFINRLGASQYGIWMFVNSIIASIGIVNMGLGDATIKFVSKYKSLNEEINLNRIVNTLFSLSLLFLAIFIVLGNCFAFTLKSYNFFKLNEKDLLITFSTIQLGSIVFGLKQIEQVLLSVFKGFEKYDVSARISIISKTLLIVLQVVVVELGYFLIEVFIISAVVSLVMVVGELLYTKLRFKEITFYPTLRRTTIKEIFGFSSWSWIQSVLAVIAGQVDRLFVISFAGPKFLAYYALASNIGAQVHSVLAASVSWIFPKVSAKTELKEDPTQLYYKLQFILVLFVIFVFGILLSFESVIFKSWLGKENYDNSILLIKIFLYLALFNSLSIIPHYFMLGSNLIKFSTLIMFISLVLTIGFMLLGFKIWDTNGLAYGKLLSSLISIPVLIIFIHYKIINKLKFKTGYEIYLPVILFACSIYMFNIYSIAIVLLIILLIIFLYKRSFN